MTRPRLCWVGILLLLEIIRLPMLGSAAAAEPSPLIHWRSIDESPGNWVAEVTNLPVAALRTLARTNWAQPQWQRLFSVFAEQGNSIADVEMPPMAGNYRVVTGLVRFVPSFPLEPGIYYRAVFRLDNLPGASSTNGTLLATRHRIPLRPAIPSTKVSQIHPTASVLPENLLKFYIEFSAPMSRGHIYDYIQLRKAAGQPVELPFLEINEELWNPEMTRLTLFLDPGRIKRGVRPLEETGPSLVEGQNYTLVIDRSWQDAAGTPLQATFSKTFRVSPADRLPPDPTAWKFETPPRGSRKPLVVQFNEPLDHAILQRVLRVVDPTGHAVYGTVALADDAQRWSIVPDQPWAPGEHFLQVPTAIEDLAGNNIGKPFDLDLTERSPESATNRLVRLSFRIR